MGNNIFDFVAEQSNAADVGHHLVILAFALAFVLACLIVLTYQISTPALKQSLDFMQSLILLAIVATTIMQAIGDGNPWRAGHYPVPDKYPEPQKHHVYLCLTGGRTGVRHVRICGGHRRYGMF